MSYKIELSDNFKKEAKNLIKKYASLKEELAQLFTQLEQTPAIGTPLGNNIYKIRLSIASKNKGKKRGSKSYVFCESYRYNRTAFLYLQQRRQGQYFR